MDEKVKCKIIQDLLPKYRLKMVSEEGRELIKNHLNNCPECKEKYSNVYRMNIRDCKRKIGENYLSKIFRYNNIVIAAMCIITVFLYIIATISPEFGDFEDLIMFFVFMFFLLGCVGFISSIIAAFIEAYTTSKGIKKIITLIIMIIICIADIVVVLQFV